MRGCLGHFFFSSIVDPFVDFGVAEAQAFSHALYAARAPATVHLELVLHDRRLFCVEALALDCLEKGLILPVHLAVALDDSEEAALILLPCMEL